MTSGLASSDTTSQSWWDATRARRLLVQRCNGCGHYQHYPRLLCLHCARTDLSYVEACGRGTIYSYTEIYRAPSPRFVVPYVVALVRLVEGPILLTRIVGKEGICCDAPVTVAWETLPDGRNLPVFEVATIGPTR